MFDIGYSELLLIGVVTLLVVGPKDLPRVLRTVGQWIGRGRSMARHFRSGIDNMIRESELEEMNKQWAAQNAAIMAATPVIDDPDDIEDRAVVRTSQPQLTGQAPESPAVAPPEAAAPVAPDAQPDGAPRPAA